MPGESAQRPNVEAELVHNSLVELFNAYRTTETNYFGVESPLLNFGTLMTAMQGWRKQLRLSDEEWNEAWKEEGEIGTFLQTVRPINPDEADIRKTQLGALRTAYQCNAADLDIVADSWFVAQKRHSPGLSSNIEPKAAEPSMVDLFDAYTKRGYITDFNSIMWDVLVWRGKMALSDNEWKKLRIDDADISRARHPMAVKSRQKKIDALRIAYLKNKDLLDSLANAYKDSEYYLSSAK